MKLETVTDPEPDEGQVVVRLEAAGVNFIDINQRSGAYKVTLPFTPGQEGAGVVTDVGAGVTEVEPGDRVAFAGTLGAYAERILVPADRLVPMPDDVGADVAAAVMLQGMTVQYLLNSVCDLADSDWCVIHAAAGGVGLLFIQMAKRKGLAVIGTVSTEEKAERARRAGADHVIVYSEQDFADSVRDLTDGRGVRAVFDSVGKDTFEGSLRCLARRGYLVLFGQASGPPEPFFVPRLTKGSLFLTRPMLADYTATRDELLWRGGEVLSLVAHGDLDVHIHARYELKDATEAHRAIQARETTGKSLLLP